MDSVQTILGNMFRELEQENLRREYEDAKADPLKNKLTRVMEKGVSLSYRYWPGRRTKRREVRWCYSVHRNAAGFFLAWREVITPDAMKRDMWTARRVKARLIELQRERSRRDRGVSK